MLPLLLAAKVWHYWLAVPLVAAPLLVCIALLIGYLVKIVGPRYPRQ